VSEVSLVCAPGSDLGQIASRPRAQRLVEHGHDRRFGSRIKGVSGARNRSFRPPIMPRWSKLSITSAHKCTQSRMQALRIGSRLSRPRLSRTQRRSSVGPGATTDSGTVPSETVSRGARASPDAEARAQGADLGRVGNPPNARGVTTELRVRGGRRTLRAGHAI
jgi:hypothetical protein